MPVHLKYFIDPDIYFDIEGLGSPFTIGIPIGITNNEAITLYFRAELVAPPPEYGNTSKDLGSVGAGASKYFIFDPTRTTPTLVNGEYDESLTLRLSAYTDSLYTDLYGYDDLSLVVHYFDHTDPAWTTIYHDTFDDGTAQGWTSESGATADATITAVGSPFPSGTHYISAPYGLINGGTGVRTNYKNYTVGVYTKARIVFHYWLSSLYRSAVKIGDKLVLPASVSEVVPRDVWVRFAFDFPVNATTKVRWQTEDAYECWIDEIWIIAK